MKKTVYVKTTIIYCDICGKECRMSHTVITDSVTGKENHACHNFTEIDGDSVRCDHVLKARESEKLKQNVQKD